MRSIVHMTDAAHSGIMTPSQLTTINQSQLSAQLGLNLGGTNLPHTSPSPPASKSATPSPSSSINEEDADESNRVSYSMRCNKIYMAIYCIFINVAILSQLPSDHTKYVSFNIRWAYVIYLPFSFWLRKLSWYVHQNRC